jgi:hypothetical protein
MRGGKWLAVEDYPPAVTAESPGSIPYQYLWGFVVFNNRNLSNLNRKTLKCVIDINLLAASDNCLLLQNI